MAAAEDRKRKSEDEDGDDTFDDDEGDNDGDDSFDSEGSESEDDEELEALQQLSDQIQEAKATNQKLKATLIAHQSKKVKTDQDHSQRDLVEALFASRKEEQTKKEGDTIV